MKIFIEKEKIYWNRTLRMHKKFGIIGKVLIFLPLTIIITIGHYTFAFMTALHMLYLKIFTRKKK